MTFLASGDLVDTFDPDQGTGHDGLTKVASTKLPMRREPQRPHK
jgi:hypothetical protein